MSNRDVERLLCGKLPEDAGLRSLAPMLSAFHDINWPAPSDEAVAAFAAAAAALAGSSSPASPSRPAAPDRIRYPGPALQRGMATGLASVVLVAGLTGVAVASDDALPGDVLYGVDRALESIGVGAGGTRERISEVRALFERGEIADAVDHAIQTAANINGESPAASITDEKPNSAAALRSAADRMEAAEGESGNRIAAVAALLEELATMLEDPALDANGFGQSVAERARLLQEKESFPSGTGQSGLGPPESDTPEPGNSDQAAKPPSDTPPGGADDPDAPASQPGKSHEKADSPPGQASGKPASPTSP